MPLQTVEEHVKPTLNRRRIFIDSSTNETSLERFSGAPTTDVQEVWRRYNRATFTLPTPIDKPLGISLTGFNFNRRILPTFHDRYVNGRGETVPANNILDCRFVIEGVTYTGTATIKPGYYEYRDDLTEELEKTILEALVDSGGPDYLGFRVQYLLNTRSLDFYIGAFSNRPNYSLEFLFGTGPNKNESPWYELGFDRGVDVGGLRNDGRVGSSYAPVPLREATLQPYRYADVFVHEYSDFEPVARINLCTGDIERVERNETGLPEGQLLFADEVGINTSTDQLRSGSVHPNMLLFEAPPRRMDKITVSVRFAQGIEPYPELDDDFDLVFDVTFMSRLTQIPAQVSQTLAVS
jgi:hypothetical protein